MEVLTTQVDNKSRLLIKSVIIGVIVLVLQVPSFYIENLITEREERQKQAITEVSSKWAGTQEVQAPSVIVPYLETTGTDANNTVTKKKFASFSPDQLSIQSIVKPIEKYRGIYKVMLYNSSIKMSGSFADIDISRLRVPPANILWNESFLKMNVSDPKGLNDKLVIDWNGKPLNFSSESPDAAYAETGFFTALPLTGPEALKGVNFKSAFPLNGSNALMFLPVGRETTVELRSAWPHPSFVGDILPNTTAVNDSGFTASWKSMAHNRPLNAENKILPVEPTNGNQPTVTGPSISSASFGANLFIPVNSYQKTYRSVKYSFLCILLTFAAFFLVETTNKKAIHPFQYGLVGLALILFYTLLLSFSEYIGFNPAYGIAAFFTIGLVGWFLKDVLASNRSAALLATVLLFIYTYVFTILQLQDYALLLGSLGLFLTLAIIMHFSKKIQW
jgi:inner membrane protein